MEIKVKMAIPAVAVITIAFEFLRSPDDPETMGAGMAAAVQR